MSHCDFPDLVKNMPKKKIWKETDFIIISVIIIIIIINIIITRESLLKSKNHGTYERISIFQHLFQGSLSTLVTCISDKGNRLQL